MNLKFLTCSFGFISGFLILITGNTLNFWLAKYGVSREIIGIFSLVALPYAFNFLWAPIFDNFTLSFLPLNINYRLKWLAVIYIACFVVTIFIASSSIDGPLFTISAGLIILAFLNSSQDLILNSIRTEITPHDLKSTYSGFYIFGYRAGMVFSGPLAIYASEYISFSLSYLIFAFFYLALIGFIFLMAHLKLVAKEEIAHSNKDLDKRTSIFSALIGIGELRLTLMILSFLALYRIGDNFISVMINPYLIYHNFTEEQIAFAGKFSGIVGSAIGGIMASFILNNKNLVYYLFWFGIIHSISHLSYLMIGIFGLPALSLLLATICDSVTSGLAMSAYIGLITCLCNGKYKATQYAIFTAMMGLSRTLLSSASGFAASFLGWTGFFIASMLMIIPSLIILKLLENKINNRINNGYFNR
ncbi:MAG: MFS transporter [Rickettsiaceae bacterium]|nr:MFS transporter [Rickettsiaceae bacterium]